MLRGNSSGPAEPMLQEQQQENATGHKCQAANGNSAAVNDKGQLLQQSTEPGTMRSCSTLACASLALQIILSMSQPGNSQRAEALRQALSGTT